MSRCFPFPPPGYQTAVRSDHVDLLAKEKHKERKYKKEKKDKEKRESKEKKDKDKSKDKHKEKKDRKEKHKDKKKDKDRDKNRTSDDKRIEERLEGHHEIKLGGNSQQGAQEVHDSKFTEELGRRIRDEEKVTTNSMAENITGSIQRRTKGMGIAFAEENQRFTGTETVPSSINTSERRNNEMGQQVDNFSGSIKKTDGMCSAITMEKDRRKAENRVTDLTSTKNRRNHEMGCTAGGKPISSMQERFQGRVVATERGDLIGADKVSNTIDKMVPNIISTEQRKNNRMDQPGVPTRVEGNKNGTMQERERGKNNNMLSKLFDPIEGRNNGAGHPAENHAPPSVQSATEKVRGRPSQMVANLISTDQRRNVGMETDMYSSTEGKKTRDRDTEAFKGDMHKDGDRKEKKNKGKGKDRHEKKEKEKEKMREKGENKHGNSKPGESGKKDTLDTPIIKPLAPHIDSANNVVTDGNINKRKDIKINGFLHENVARPNKILRTSFPSNLPLENGTRENGTVNKIIVRIPENEEHKINGIPEPRPSSIDLRSPVVAGTSKSEVCLKPPHADSKYLNQIYSIPRLEELPEFDEQEWLFSSNDLRSRSKDKVGTEEAPQVWAEAMQIESADVTALPYVIPF